MDFDVAIATPDMMPTVGKLGRSSACAASCRNPRPAPSPRRGQGRGASSGAARSSTAPTARATCTCPRQGQLRPRRPRHELQAVIEELDRVKPASAKGPLVRRVTLSSTMGPSIKVDHTRSDDDAEAPSAD